MKLRHTLFFCFAFGVYTVSLLAQEKITVSAPYYDKNETELPGATILTRNQNTQIHMIHDGIEMWCDKAYHYAKKDSIAAFGNVRIKQGDTINLTSNIANYSGKTQLAFTAGNVILTEPNSTLHTDTLYFNKQKQEAYYKSGGVVKQPETVINSRIGRYFMTSKKYQFIGHVDIVNPRYTLVSNQLDFYPNSGFAYLYGASTIKHKTTTIYCERGFYDTKADLGYFVKNSKIHYQSRIFEGDSMYFDQKRHFASATNNIKVTDTANNSIITGHYAEVYKAKDSVFITKRALIKTLQEKDSIYVHADTLMVTGKPEQRIIRGFRNAKLFKQDLSGKCDSIHINQQTGITKLINKPVLWSGSSQMTGDTIRLTQNTDTQKLDSLYLFYNSFLIQKDSIDGYNQIKGKTLVGLFNDENQLQKVHINKNTEHLQYTRKNNGELFGLNKIISSSINITFYNNQIEIINYIGNPEGDLMPDSMFPKNTRKLRGFNWRGEEQIKSIEDLFKDDAPLLLPKINGLQDRIISIDDIPYTKPSAPQKKPTKKPIPIKKPAIIQKKGRTFKKQAPSLKKE